MSKSLAILVLYYSRTGHTRQLARAVCRGIDAVPGAEARLRTVAPLRAAHDPQVTSALPDDGAPYVERADLAECAALLLGSPGRFGNMAAPLKHFLDSLGAEWASGTLIGKPAGVFVSTSTPHGGQESVALSMMLPLLHHGMLIVGLPYSERALTSTVGGGSPYGAGYVSAGTERPNDDEQALAQALGKRVASLALKLAP